MITNTTQKLVVSAFLAFATIANVSADTERYTQEYADMLLRHHYPHMANQQKTAEVAASTPQPTPKEQEVLKPTITQELTTPFYAPARHPKAVVPTFLEEMDYDLEKNTTSSMKDIVLEKTRSLVQKAKAAFSKPGTQAATLALSLGAYTVTKAIKAALAQHADKQGTEKLAAIYSSIKSLGLSKVLSSVRASLSQDGSTKQALVGFAVDSVAELATTALVKLAQAKLTA